ncbi:MAG: 30S ribosomal protein S17e [Euryarchaeota archaeon]|nr:30S ribosomal protein S17e [Euryarchaeota archaeon]
MGNIRPSNIKRVARELVNTYGDKFNGDFDHNKKVVSQIADIQTKRLRNMLAGYVTRYWKVKKRREEGS